MEGSKAEHNLIESILILLNSPEYEDMVSGRLTKEEWLTKLPCLSAPEQLRTAFEVIQFMDQMPGGFLIYHAHGKEEVIYANQALLRLFMCNTMQEFRDHTNNSFRGIVYSEDLEYVEESIWAQIRENQYDMDYVEYRIIQRDGTIRWVDDYGHFIHSPSVGDVFYVFIGDATEKKERQLRQKMALIEKEQKIQDLIEEFNREKRLINQEHLRHLEIIEGLGVNYDCILYADLDIDQIIPYRLSTRTECQFGKRFQEQSYLWYISDYLRMWVHPEDQKLFSTVTSPEYIRERLRENNTYFFNYRVLFHEEIQYLQLRIINVGQANHISQIVMGYRRIDEEFRREREQKELLEAALKSANLAITAKNTFLSNMSHDMRTPLNAIFGFTILAKTSIQDNQEAMDYLDRIETSGKQLLELIDKVLEMSWAETNDIQVKESEFNLCSLMEEIHKALFPQAVQKNVEYFTNMADIKHRSVYGDPDKLRQVLRYLASNAVKYTKKGGKVHVSVKEGKALTKDYVLYQFIVQDTGIGISKEFMEHIFEPFEREKNTTMSGIYGSGLGLSIAKNIVEIMGGSIEADSTLHKGSTFTVTLRLRVQSQPTLPVSDKKDPVDLLKGKKILLVEDNEINLEIETEILTELGFQIETAENGNIAVEKISRSQPGEFGLVLMDIQMPIMDGRTATEVIRRFENPFLAHIPIIALSADAFESDRKRSMECGMDEHLAKPIDVPMLLAAMTDAIQAYQLKYNA